MTNRFYPAMRGFVYVTTQSMEPSVIEETCKAFFEATGEHLTIIPNTEPGPDHELAVLQDKMKKLQAIMSKYRATPAK